MKESQGRTVYLKDYQTPDFFIDETELTVKLFEEETLVHSRLTIRRNPDADGQAVGRELLLDGANMTLLELRLDGKVLAESDYTTAHESLIITDVPDAFVLERSRGSLHWFDRPETPV